MYFEKDFFGDPIWPTEPDQQKSRLTKISESCLVQNNISFIRKQNQENSISSQRESSIQDQSQDFQRTFLQSEQKMQYSNLKHSEITYLDDFQRQHIFFQEDEQILQKPYQKEDRQKIQQRMKQILVKFQEDEPFSDYHSESQSSNQNQIPEHHLVHTNSNSIVERYEKKVQKPLKRRSLAKEKKSLKKNSHFRKQNSIIDQLLDEKCLMGDNEKKRKMLKVQYQIIRKLKYQQQSNKEKQQATENIHKKSKKRSKFPKYKILTQSQKQYLVFLSTLSTTCEVSRRFNISVNNICRWKKGCVRKVGAGRKITNQNLQSKVIQYVKDLVKKGETLTRKKVQMKAKQLSEDKSFKASKGWFERFYTRNIEIFPSQQKEEQY